MYGKIIKVYCRGGEPGEAMSEPDFVVECPKCGNQEAYLGDGELNICFADTDLSTCVKCDCEYRLKKIDILKSLVACGFYSEEGLSPDALR